MDPTHQRVPQVAWPHVCHVPKIILGLRIWHPKFPGSIKYFHMTCWSCIDTHCIPHVKTGFHSHGGTPSHHPFIDAIFPNKNHPAMGVPSWLWKPPCGLYHPYPHPGHCDCSPRKFFQASENLGLASFLRSNKKKRPFRSEAKLLNSPFAIENCPFILFILDFTPKKSCFSIVL